MSYINEVAIDGYIFNIGKFHSKKPRIPMQIMLDLDDEKIVTALKNGNDSLLKALLVAYKFSYEIECINTFYNFEYHITQGTGDWSRYAYHTPFEILDEYKSKALVAVSSKHADDSCRMEAQRYLDFLNGIIPKYEPTQSDLLHRREEKFRRSRSKWLKLLVERDGYKCSRCAITQDLCVKHTVSLSKGGETELNNLKLFCRLCMNKK
jgi:5-methylcytosine-specific restriction endonuclease McrA